jgi:hypothetical protein
VIESLKAQVQHLTEKNGKIKESTVQKVRPESSASKDTVSIREEEATEEKRTQTRTTENNALLLLLR